MLMYVGSYCRVWRGYCIVSTPTPKKSLNSFSEDHDTIWVGEGRGWRGGYVHIVHIENKN